jgi:tetratricopeptide (TPR) repeat protein
MPVDKNKLVAEATRYVQKGQWDKAIRVYEKILADDPRDVRVLLKIGELQQKKGDPASASDTLHRVAKAYTDQGFFLKAVAVYKQIVRLTPGDVRVNEKLAALYQQLGIVSDAMTQLQVVSQAAEAAGDDRRLLDVLGRMVELDPEHAGAATRLGELHARNGDAAAALVQLRRAADILRRSNRAEDHLRVLERIATLDPADGALVRELANAYLRRGDSKRALAKLQLLFQADPQDVETLGLLATAFHDLGQTAKTLSVYRELARVEAERGRRAQSRAAWQRVLDLAPDDAEAKEALAGLSAPGAPGAAPAPAFAPPPPRASAPTPAPVHDAVPKLLQETDVFAKYGLHKKALDHLERVFALDPDHVEARERARDLCASAGDARLAADHGARAVEAALAARDVARAGAALRRLAELAPDDPRLATLGDALRRVEGEEAGAADEVLEALAVEDVVIEPEPLAPAADDGFFDFARELAEELDSVSFAPADAAAGAGEASDVVPELERGVERSAVGEDGDAHYDLGIAYKEMGLLDDAIRELEIAQACNPPRSPVDCLTMIGLCRMEQGDAAAAVETYRRALAAAGDAPEAERALHYELARAYEGLGDADAALWYLQKVLRTDPRFRDAGEIAARLGGGAGRPPPGGPEQEPDEPQRAGSNVGYV